MDEDQSLEWIRKILEDDDNYQTPALKLGGIWAVCDSFATYRRSCDGTAVFVERKE